MATIKILVSSNGTPVCVLRPEDDGDTMAGNIRGSVTEVRTNDGRYVPFPGNTTGCWHVYAIENEDAPDGWRIYTDAIDRVIALTIREGLVKLQFAYTGFIFVDDGETVRQKFLRMIAGDDCVLREES